MQGSARFDHLGALYRTADEYLGLVLGFVRAALSRGNPVLVAVPQPNLDWIRAGLGDDAGRVVLADMALNGRNPGRIIPALLHPFAESHPGRRVCIVGEPTWSTRSPMEYPACVTHEAVVNLAFAGRDAEMLCTYDATGLGAQAITDAHRAHPLLYDTTGSRANHGFEDPVTTLSRFNMPLPAPDHAESLDYDDSVKLAEIRRLVADRAIGAGLAGDRLEGLVVAVNELASNTIRHTGKDGRLTIWVADGMLICQVTDSGQLTDPLAGRIPPQDGRTGGLGLIMVNQLVDLVRQHVSPLGTTIRVHQGLGTSRIGT